MAIGLGERLRQVVGAGRGSGERSNADPGLDRVDGQVPIEQVAGGGKDGHRIADILGGRWLESMDGAVLVVDRYYTSDRRHGRTRIGDIVETLEAGLEALQIMGRAWPGRDPRPYTTRLCFFDLETTGLAGGAGTQAFLVGCACVEDGGLRICQFLLPGFEHERALLATLAEWPNFGTSEPQNPGTPETQNSGISEPRNPGTPKPCTLVTFNGRSFDVPLIETRYLFHRLAFPFGEAPHLDMLHPARRLWKQRPVILGPSIDDDSCRLSVLERHLAGYHRIGDIPAFEIPSRYFRFIRYGEVHPLEAVLEHNRIDLVSLALVTAHAITLITKGPCAAMHPREAFGLGRVYERSGLSESAEASYVHAASFAACVGREPDIRAEALRRLALCRRRDGRPAEAAVAWQELLSLGGCPATLRREAREALAIHHEHRLRDLDTARLLVLDVLSERPGARTRAAAEYRLRRIDRKRAVRAVRHEGGLLAALEDAS